MLHTPVLPFLVDQGKILPVSDPSPVPSHASFPVCSASLSLGSHPILSSAACSISSRADNQNQLQRETSPMRVTDPTVRGGSQGQVKSSRGHPGFAGVHLGPEPVENPLTVETVNNLIAQAIRKEFSGLNARSLVDTSPSVSLGQGPRPTIEEPGSPGYSIEDTRHRQSVWSHELDSDGIAAESDPQSNDFASVCEGESAPAAESMERTTKVQKLLSHIAQFLPEVSLTRGSASSSDRSSSRLGIFRRRPDSLVLGPSQLLQDMCKEITPDSLVSKKLSQGFVSPIPLAPDFLVSEPHTTLSAVEQEHPVVSFNFTDQSCTQFIGK